MTDPKRIIQDGSVIQFSNLQDGSAVDPDTGETVILQRVAGSNTYRASLKRSDGKNINYFVDKPNDPLVTVSRKIQ